MTKQEKLLLVIDELISIAEKKYPQIEFTFTVERGFTPLRKSIIIEAYASNGYTESSKR